MSRKEKVILYGAASGLDQYYLCVKTVYDIVGVSDSNPKKREKVEKMGETFIEPKDISSHDFDYIFVTSDYYNEISFTLIHVYNIDRNKVLPYTFFGLEKKFSPGHLSPEKTFYVFRPLIPNDFTGLFGCVNMLLKLIRFIDGQGYELFFDFQNYRNRYLDDSKLGKENSWEYYFKQPCGEKSENIYKSKNVVLGTGSVSFITEPVLDKDSGRSFSSYKELYKKYIVLSDDMQRRIDEEYKRLFEPLKRNGKKICGVFYRGTEYVKLKPYNHRIQPTISQAIEKTKELMGEWGFDCIYFDSEDNKAFKAFCEAFPENIIYSERPRIDEYPDEITNYRFDRENDKFLISMEYLRSCYLMAKCDYFISGHNNGFSAIMNIANGFEKLFVFDLGTYGIDDDSYYATPDGKPVYVNRDKA